MEGHPNYMYLQGLELPRLFKEAHKFFHDNLEDEAMTMTKFFTHKRFALVVDL